MIYEKQFCPKKIVFYPKKNLSFFVTSHFIELQEDHSLTVADQLKQNRQQTINIKQSSCF